MHLDATILMIFIHTGMAVSQKEEAVLFQANQRSAGIHTTSLRALSDKLKHRQSAQMLQQGVLPHCSVEFKIKCCGDGKCATECS